MSSPHLLWYGDDFTGAADTLATLAASGWRAMLFRGPPSGEDLANAATALGGGLDAIGIAGIARSLAPGALADELEPVAECFLRSGCRILHFKICSTFDSSPDVGNIASAIRILRRVTPNRFVPIAGGQPSLGRYCAFGTLFAATRAGGDVVRIDRHPTMSKHPVTPMNEADLRQHLGLQGLENIGAWHLPAWKLSPDGQQAALQALVDQGSEAVLFDVTETAHLVQLGALIRAQAAHKPVLAVGASSVAQALSLESDGAPCATASNAEVGLAPRFPRRGPVLILAGSLSPVTAAQVEHATDYAVLRLDAQALSIGPQGCFDAHDRIVSLLAEGANVLAVTAPEPGRPVATGVNTTLAYATRDWLISLLARLVKEQISLRRVGIAGGDTASLAVRALPVWGLSYVGSLGPGTPIIRLHAGSPHLDGLELMLKGGQMGSLDIFNRFSLP